MKNQKWFKIVIAVLVLCAAATGIYLAIGGLLGGRGVAASKDDVIAVIRSMLPYLIVIGAALLAILVSFVLCSVLKLGSRKKLTIRIQTITAGVLAILISINLICVGPASSLLNVTAGAKGALSEETREESYALASQIAEEGIVLLKNEGGALPLDQSVTKLNVFGWSSTTPLYGGTGSGAFTDTEHMVTLLQGLELAGYELNEELIKFYTKYRDARPDIGMYIQDWTVPEPTMKEYDRKKIFEGAKEFSDTALVVISRSGGEGADLPMSITDEDTVANAAKTGSGVRYTSNADDVDLSKSYLELTNRETALVERVNETFSNVVVVINAANTMELGWIDDYENINGVV